MYTFKNIEGNKLNIKSLQNAIKNNKVFHAYIFYGEKGIGKNILARTFAKTLQCEKNNIEPCNFCISCKTFEDFNNPDVSYVNSNSSNYIGIDVVREKINKNLNIKPYNNKYKIIIIDDADKMTIASQNSILKTIEDMPNYGILIFLADNINKFLPTVFSRCIKYKLDNLNIKDIKNYLYTNTDLKEDLVNIYSIYSQGNIGKILQLLKDKNFIDIRNYIIDLILNLDKQNLEEILDGNKIIEKFRDNLENIFDILILWFRDAIILKEIKNTNFIFQQDKIDYLLFYIEKFNLENLYNKFKIVLKAKESLNYKSNFKLTVQIMLLNLK